MGATQNEVNSYFEYADYHATVDTFLSPIRFGGFELYQIGRLHCKPSTVIHEHTHLNFIELTIATSGRGRVLTNGRETVVERGDIHISLPGDFHMIVSDRLDPLHYDYCAFAILDGELSREFDSVAEGHHAPEERIIRDGRIPRLVADAYEEITKGAAHSERLLNAYFDAITINLIRDLTNEKSEKDDGRTDDATRLCYRMMNYIDTHIYEMKSLYELADVTSYNYNYLSNLFREVTSGTLANYFRTRKMQTARLLLREGKLSVTQVASLLGYSSVYTFSRAFKEAYGVSPTGVIGR